ncbi:MAG: Nitratenitrite transporter [Bradyrhizobium sp.]|nr:Nitratenitrite transporter [Bradyrhizobium sp.]
MTGMAGSQPDTAVEEIERATMRKVVWRIVPLLALVLFCSFLDRVNLSFAALTMNRDLGLSKTAFGLAAGCFSIGYALFGIPSSLLLHRFGTRRWISLTMIIWGLLSALTAFVNRPAELFALRLLLGMAEAGFSPGMILYFSTWFPAAYRGSTLGFFFAIQPVALIIAGPVSSLLLAWDGWLGLAGWQWLFLVEALPTILLAFVLLRLLADRPGLARWLDDGERQWLEARLASEQAVSADGRPGPAWRVFKLPRLWILALVYLLIGTCGNGVTLFLPLVIRSTGISLAATGWVAAIPAVAAALALPLWGNWTDRVVRRETIVAAACLTMACGLAGSAGLLPSPWAIVPLSLAMVGFFGTLAPFWTLPSTFLAGSAAAIGIAMINIVGNFGSFSGPALIGLIADRSPSFAAGQCALAALAGTAALIVLASGAARGERPRPSA